MRVFAKKAQSTAEYAIVIALVIGAAIAMQVYVRRGMQGGIKFATDKLKSSDDGVGQYEPYYMQSETTSTRADVKSTEEFGAGGYVQRKTGELTAEGEKSTRAYKQEMRGVDQKTLTDPTDE